MDYAALALQHGYWLLALGCFLEGETALLLAGFAAHQGYLSLPVVMLVATLAASLGDQCFFWLGRTHGAALLARFPKIAARAPRIHALLQAHDAWLIIALRFTYGLRTAGPILLGTAGIPAYRFALFNLLGAILWAIVIGTLGWFVGAAARAMLGRLHHVEMWLFAAIAIVGLGLAVYRRRR